jgi:hypothetical protein
MGNPPTRFSASREESKIEESKIGIHASFQLIRLGNKGASAKVKDPTREIDAWRTHNANRSRCAGFRPTRCASFYFETQEGTSKSPPWLKPK